MASEEKKVEIGKTKKLAELKTILERKIADAELELESLKILLDLVNKTLLQKGFKRAEIAELKSVEMPALPSVVEYETVIPLKSVTGELLANLHMSQDSMRVVVSEEKTFNVNTPPFQQFLIERVLNKMQEKDRDAVSKGEITPGKTFSYELILDGETIQEIVIENVTSARLRELKSSIHWTFEKMYEKMKEDI